MVFHWGLSDSESPQVSRTRLRILVVLSNAVILIVSTRPPTSKSSRPFNNPLVIVPKAPITIDTIVTSTTFSILKQGRGIIIIIIIIISEVFSPVLADDFSLESEWQQFSQTLQNSSSNSGRSW